MHHSCVVLRSGKARQGYRLQHYQPASWNGVWIGLVLMPYSHEIFGVFLLSKWCDYVQSEWCFDHDMLLHHFQINIKQEGWLSPTERVSVFAVSHFGLPWVCPWDYRGNCHMDEKRIQCLSNALQHVPIYLQPFPSNSTRKFKSLPFQHILASPRYAPGTIAVNVTWMERGFNAGQMHSSIYHLSSTIYKLQRDIGQKLQLFPSPLHLTPLLGCSHWNSGKKLGLQKTRIMWLPGSEDRLTIG